jgi:L-ribulose-5-phosphate 3-epimerase
MRNNLGIMQGRLSPIINSQIQAFPENLWENEFNLANKIGFDCIEWIIDSESNPLFSDSIISKISHLSQKYKIQINSVCADIFMNKLLFKEKNDIIHYNLELLKKIIYQCDKCKIKILELPFVDSSSIQNEKFQKEVLENLKSIKPFLEKTNVIIGLETDLESNLFLQFLKKLNSDHIKANYDVGNSVANNFDPVTDLDILNKWIINIHLKDRLKFGQTVSLGTGDVIFDDFFKKLSQINYNGDLIIQGAREDINQNISPEITCSKYYKFISRYIEKYE